ncbi:MAG: phosphoadenylyl-sulfate reductase [Blastocatellia bacterium]
MTQVICDVVKSAPPPGEPARLEAAARLLEHSPPEDALRWAFDQFQESVTIATGFGAEGVALIDMVMAINPRADIFFLDTSFLFAETYELRSRLEDRYNIQIRGFRSEITPEEQERRFGAKLWASDPDLCCRLRKLEPLREALRGKAAWITAIRRDQTIERSNARVVEWDYTWQLAKVNPLVRWSKQQVWDRIAKHNIPYNLLHDQGYPSIGCTHCTRPVLPGEPERSGRWAGRSKRECGMHAPVQTTTFVRIDEPRHSRDAH